MHKVSLVVRGRQWRGVDHFRRNRTQLRQAQVQIKVFARASLQSLRLRAAHLEKSLAEIALIVFPIFTNLLAQLKCVI